MRLARARRLVFALALAAAMPALAQDAAPAPATADPTGQWSSHRDFLDPAMRDVPVACKPGDLERQPGKSLGQVFGSDWPPAPAATNADAAQPPRPLAIGKLAWPPGLEGQRAIVVMAVLIGTDGKPLRAEPLCASAAGFDRAARRAVMAGSYAPATVNGQAIVSPLVAPVRFSPPRRGPGGDSKSDSASGD